MLYVLRVVLSRARYKRTKEKNPRDATAPVASHASQRCRGEGKPMNSIRYLSAPPPAHTRSWYKER